MSAAAAITNKDLASWRVSGHPYKLIAALIVEWARDQERGTAVPENDYFATKLPLVVGPKPFKRARELLAARGVLFANDGPYMVA